MQVGAWLSAMSDNVTVAIIGKGDEFFESPSPIGVPRPLPILWVYWDYVQFGESQLPPTHTPGSARQWREFRLVHRMYNKWRGLKDGNEEVKLDLDNTWEDRYIPPVKPKRQPSSSGSRTGRRIPNADDVP